LAVTKAKCVGILVIAGHAFCILTITRLRTTPKDAPTIHCAVVVALAGNTIVNEGAPAGPIFSGIDAKDAGTGASQVAIGVALTVTVLRAIEDTTLVRIAVGFARVIVHALDGMAVTSAVFSLVGVPTAVAGPAGPLPGR
jgi:hypothetical protein